MKTYILIKKLKVAEDLANEIIEKNKARLSGDFKLAYVNNLLDIRLWLNDLNDLHAFLGTVPPELHKTLLVLCLDDDNYECLSVEDANTLVSCIKNDT